jgi:hypothetical protein
MLRWILAGNSPAVYILTKTCLELGFHGCTGAKMVILALLKCLFSKLLHNIPLPLPLLNLLVFQALLPGVLNSSVEYDRSAKAPY